MRPRQSKVELQAVPMTQRITQSLRRGRLLRKVIKFFASKPTGFKACG